MAGEGRVEKGLELGQFSFARDKYLFRHRHSLYTPVGKASDSCESMMLVVFSRNRQPRRGLPNPVVDNRSRNYDENGQSRGSTI